MQGQHTEKTNIVFAISVFLFGLISFGFFDFGAFATNCTSGTCSENVTFRVSVDESLTVSVTTPPSWASGGLTNTSGGKSYSNLLRNKITLGVTTNNSAGFTASMTTESSSGALKNTLTNLSSDTIPTLTSSWTRSDTSTTKFWGYSLDDDNDTGTYYGVAKRGDTPNTILSSNVASSSTQDIYFGAKADSTIASGTYAETVIISVVTGVITNENPITPTNPATPEDGGSTNPYYDAVNDRTVFKETTTDSNGTTTTTSIHSGDTR